ncbi:MAG: hypothetical protein ACFE9S_12935 [Candidatus Hermodarchaeota archaeon]
MQFIKNQKNRRILLLLLLAFTFSFMNFNQFFWNFNNSTSDSNSFTDPKFFNKLKTSDYSSNYGGIGENMNITLHQSYLNNSFNLILNTSDSNNNKFTLPCPTDTTFNSSYTYVTVSDINAPNRTLEIETGVSGSESIRYVDHALSFQVPGDGILDNLSICFSETQLLQDYDALVNIELWSASWNTGFSDWGPNGFIATIKTGLVIYNDTNEIWYNITNINQQLDVSATNNNMFFIFLTQTTSSSLAEVKFHREVDGSSDDSKVWKDDGGWQPVPGIDPSMILHLLPVNNTPKPTEINLKINNEVVTNIVNNKGYWESTEVNSSASGELQYTVLADWWDVTCNISQVQINFTKTNLKATSEFIIGGSGQIVEWNVTRIGGLNYFDSRFNNYQINYTIPNNWDKDTIRVFNGIIPKTSDSTNRSLGNGYREVNILNAGNGLFWYLTAESGNLVSSIDTYIGIDSADTFNFTDIAHFEATFTTNIQDNDGIINLSVYSPALINNELNYSVKVESFTGGSIISLADWDISNNVIKYGNFRVQVFWSNNTAAGFQEKLITILGETELIPNLPKFRFDASESFYIDLFFNDTGRDLGISSGDITYRLNNGIIRSDDTDLGNGNYRISIDCNDADFSAYGPNFIEINASKTYYNNQSEVIQITIIGETNLDGSILKYSFDSTEIFNVSLFFNNTVKDIGVSGAIRNVYLNSTPYTPISNFDYGDGNYNITIDCDNDYFDSQGYGYFNVSVTVEKQYYYNQSVEFIIYVTGETSLSTSKFPDPSIGYYNSDEIFNITVYYQDIGRAEGINGGLVKVYVKEVSATQYQEYTPIEIDPFGVGYYNITIDCSDPLFNPYGKYNIKINVTKSHYYLAEDILEEIVVGNTTLTILSPTGTISYLENEIFDIIIEYEDHTLSSGIIGAEISHNINNAGFRFDNWVDNLDGTYTITIDVGDSDFGTEYGNIDIIIGANKTNYINLTRTFTFERQILTQILPTNSPSLVQVIRGINVTYTFNYTDRIGNPIDKYDDFQPTTPLNNFEWYLWNEGGGYYTIDIDTSNVVVIPSPYIINFSISAFGNQSQEISLTILVTIIQTRIEIESWNQNADFARSTNINISINFYFNDTTNIEAIDGLNNDDVNITDYDTGTIWSPGFELFNRPGPGNYKLNISTIGATSGNYTLQLKISKFPNYNYSLAYIKFYLRGNYSQINLITISDPGGELTNTGVNYNYTIFEGSDINLEFNVTDLEFGNSIVLGDADAYSISYNNLLTLDNGILTNTLDFVYQNPTYGTHIGTIITSNIALIAGNYLINITMIKTNYESTYFSFNLTIIEKFNVRLNITKPGEVNAGDAFNIIIKGEYYNGTEWLPLVGTNVGITPYFNDIPSTEILRISNSTGETSFEITVRSDAITMNLTVQLQEEYYHVGELLMISDIEVIPLPPGLRFEDILPYLIIGAIAVLAVGGSVAVYRGIVVPKKRKKQRILTEVKTIFDDAINLEHILVLYKGTGTCIYFKSFGSEQIDPELISGFISAISSFGKDLVSQEELNEISYGDKMLLLSDGENIRVALVLGKKASLILRRNLMEFIHRFEKAYINELPNWRGQLNIFRDAGIIVDEVLSTSIILPHEITYEYSTAKALKKPQSQGVLKIAKNLMKDSERNFFFIATLLKESTEKSGKDTAEIFMGIKELRDKKILMPIEISAIEAKPVSQQELNLINQKVSQLVNLSPEEKQKLINDLAQMGPAEREAYFVSLTERHEIVSAPIEARPEAEAIANIKGAKKEIKNLTKTGLSARKEKDYDKSIKVFQNALKIATNWELVKESQELDDIIRRIKIEDLKFKMNALEKEARLAAKKKNYNEAAQKYKMSSKIASEIFKLGEDLTKEVKRLSNKAKEYEKLL